MDTTGRQQVIDLLHRRRDGERDDEHLALGIEGGGLRGVVSGGMLAALHDLGFTADLFDSIYGASAGALAGAYFIDGSVEDTLPLYYRDVPDFFLDWSRLLRRQPVLALDRLIDETITVDRPLDFDAVVSSGKLRIIASDIGETAKLGPRRPQPVRAECFPPATSPEELRSYLRASTRIPLVGGPPVTVEDALQRPERRNAAHSYLDAFITEGLPVDAPVAAGATHLLLLATKPYTQSRAENALVAALTRWRLSRLNPNLAAQLRGIPDRAAHRAALIDRCQATPRPDEPAMWCISPTRDVGVPRLNADPDRILGGAEAGYRLVRHELGLDQPSGFDADPVFRAVFS